MKKRYCLIVLVLILSLLCGCGGSKSDYTSGAAKESAMDYGYYEAPTAVAGGWNGDYYAPEEDAYAEEYKAAASSSDVPSSGNSLPANVKLIYTANMSLESTAFETAISTIENMVADCGGYFESSNLGNYGRYRNVNYTVRIPAAYFGWFCDTVSALSVEGEILQMKNISRSAEDVSEAYYDLESRLTTQKTKLSRLQELLSKAEYMEDIITLESAISDTELTIEHLTGSLRKYDSLVGYSTIYISLAEVYKLTEIEEPAIGFGAKLAAAFKSGCTRFVNNLEDFAIGFARAWVGWLIFIAIVVIVILLIRRSIRRRRERGSVPKERKPRKERRKSRRAVKNISETENPAVQEPAPDTKEEE